MNLYKSRYEKKFIININQETLLKNKIKKIFFLDKNSIQNEGGYHIMSTYFDDNEFTNLNSKLEGDVERVKLRARAYFGKNKNNVTFWNLELKKKQNSIVVKKKIKIENSCFLNNINNQDFLKYFLNKNFISSEFYRKDFQPKITIFYFRQAYNSDIFPNCRITIDSDIKYEKGFCYNFKEMINNSNNTLNYNERILELKYTESLPSIVKNIFRELKLSQCTFSKYVDSYILTKKKW